MLTIELKIIIKNKRKRGGGDTSKPVIADGKNKSLKNQSCSNFIIDLFIGYGFIFFVFVQENVH